MEPERIFIVQEHLSGGDLFVCCQESGVLSESVARFFFNDIVAALGYLHSAGIVHRDVKQENCVLDSDGNLKLIDFGLATKFLPDQLFQEFCGSAEYAAPELLRGEFYKGPPIDVWAVGVIVFDLVVGDLPFGGESDFSFPRKKLEEAEVSDDFGSLLERILCEDPKNRITMKQIEKSKWMEKEAHIEDFDLPQDTSESIRKRVQVERKALIQKSMGF